MPPCNPIILSYISLYGFKEFRLYSIHVNRLFGLMLEEIQATLAQACKLMAETDVEVSQMGAPTWGVREDFVRISFTPISPLITPGIPIINLFTQFS